MKRYALDGAVFETLPVGYAGMGCLRDGDTCCGCGERVGSDHQPGCDWERCPRCGGQFINCDCERHKRPIYEEREVRSLIVTLTAALRSKGVPHEDHVPGL